MQTLQQLKNGDLNGVKQLKLSCELTEFPKEIFELASTLELLDLSGNKLSSLPSNFSLLSNLKIAFFSDNLFTEFPEVLSQCDQLEMVGFKANKISVVNENVFPKQLRWLILTNNYITQLPQSIGNCNRLQKCGLAGNKLTSLPSQMANCQNLEFLRISANNIIVFPKWLLTLPKLSWLAFDANPCSFVNDIKYTLPESDWDSFEIETLIGEGASGHIYKAINKPNLPQLNVANKVAIKIFKGDVTSDGLPASEINACVAIGQHQNLITTVSKIKNHPHKKEGLVFELISEDYKNLGKPPNFITCTRDVFESNVFYTINQIYCIALGVAKAMQHLHSKGIMHGDLYAHNILINTNNNHSLLGDYGAATFYDKHNEIVNELEKLDVRAFGCLLDDLLQLKKVDNQTDYQLFILQEIKNKCFDLNPFIRPTFMQILRLLKN